MRRDADPIYKLTKSYPNHILTPTLRLNTSRFSSERVSKVVLTQSHSTDFTHSQKLKLVKFSRRKANRLYLIKMCHIEKEASPVNPALLGMEFPVLSKSKPRLGPFRKIAKSARINLNKYWGLLGMKQSRKGSASSTKSAAMSITFDFSEEEEQNRINELLEAQANAEEQNSINSQIEYDSSPEQPRRLFVRQRALYSSYSSFASSSNYHSCQEFDDSLSTDSVFL